MTSLRRRSRTLVAAALATLAIAVAASGCSVTNDITTQAAYAASDGVRHELGDVVLTNILVLTAAQDEAGTVLGAVTNTGDQDVRVSIGLPDQEPAVIDLAAGQTLRLGPGEEEEVVGLESVPAAPGALVELAVVSDRAGADTIEVPVLDATFPQYAELVPGG